MKKFSLSHWTSDKPDAEIDDMFEEVVAEGDTVEGLLRFARLKKLDDEEYFIDRNFYEVINGFKIPDSERVGYLYEVKRKLCHDSH